MARGETLELLLERYQQLMKAGRGSLAAARNFGQVVEALHGLYSYVDMAEALSISTSTLWKYARLYRMYSTEHRLLAVADAMGTYDVSKLISTEAGVPLRSVLECRNCHSHDIAHKREKIAVPDTPAELLRQS